MKDIFNWKELKQHILTGISYFIPLVVGAGLTMAIGAVKCMDNKHPTDNKNRL